MLTRLVTNRSVTDRNISCADAIPCATLAANDSIRPVRELDMLLNLSQIGQIGLPVIDTDRSEAFYEQVIGLRKLYRFGDLSFFDCAGVRLFLDKVKEPDKFKPQGCIYFRCADIDLTVAELEQRGCSFMLR